MREADLYEPVARWAERVLGCFVTGTEKGLRHGRIDVVGLKDSGGRLAGTADVIAIEVKRGTQPFATAIGQASGYSIYADRCYLAEHRPDEGFSDDELLIASQLGVGLIRITGSKRFRITEVLTAPRREPLPGLRLAVVEKLEYALCTICGCFFQAGEEGRHGAYLVNQQPVWARHIDRALEEDKGLVYLLNEQGWRSSDPALDVHHRRYVCRDCVRALFGHLERGD